MKRKQKPIERKEYSYATIFKCILCILIVLLPVIGSPMYACFFNGMDCRSDLVNPIPLSSVLMGMVLILIIVLVLRRRA